MLVRAGVGRLALIDPEKLEPENLVRHMLTAKNLGVPKVEAMRNRLWEINTECEIEISASEFETCAPCDLIVSAADSYRCESMINRISLETKTPAIYPGCWGEAKTGEILYVIPGKTPCYQCFAAFRAYQEIPDDPRKYADPDFDDTRVLGQAGLWPRILIICGFAFEVILGMFNSTLTGGTLWLVNIADPELPMGVTRCRVQDGCAVCDVNKIAELTI
jgi:hypothetical protein